MKFHINCVGSMAEKQRPQSAWASGKIYNDKIFGPGREEKGTGGSRETRHHAALRTGLVPDGREFRGRERSEMNEHVKVESG